MTADELQRTADSPDAESRAQFGEFLSGFTHELKTPLASVGLIAQLLSRAVGDGGSGLGESEVRYVRNLGELTREIQTLVQDAGSLARLWSARRPVAREMVSLTRLLGKIEDATRSRGWERGISLVALRGPDVPEEIRTDPVLLEEALSALVETAMVLARQRASLRLLRAGPEIRFAITADGGCETGDEAAAVFEPFRGSTSRRIHRDGGRSLAPLLARELARALGGDVAGDCDGGRTSFVLRMPLDG